MIRVVLIDDHSIITDGVSAFFINDPDIRIVKTFNSPVQALEQLGSLEADIVMTDLSMPEMPGQQVIRTIKKDHPGLRVIVLSMFADKPLIAEAIQMGADGYVLKNTGKTELEACINQVFDGKKWYPIPLDDEFRAQLEEVRNNPMQLSERELEILKLVSEGYNSKQVADKLFLSEFTVNTHRRNMLKKTNQPNVAALVTFAKQRQWIT